jgi:hypothetical protein
METNHKTLPPTVPEIRELLTVGLSREAFFRILITTYKARRNENLLGDQ